MRQGDGGDHDEDQADGEEHLVELGGPVEPRIEQPLEEHAHGGGGHESESQGRHEPETTVLHGLHDGVAAQHGEAAMGKVDEAHQAHGDGQPNRHDEQHHARRHAAQEHAGDVDAEDHGTGRR